MLHAGVSRLHQECCWDAWGLTLTHSCGYLRSLSALQEFTCLIVLLCGETCVEYQHHSETKTHNATYTGAEHTQLIRILVPFLPF